MAGQAPLDDQADEQPLDPAVENVRRKMMRFFAINIGILIFALMAVLAAIVYKSTRTKEADPASVNASVPTEPNAPADLVLDAGESVVSQSLSGNRLSVAIARDGAVRRIAVIDLGSGQVVSSVAVSLRQ